jgi:uncharacterized protein (TIGR01777 family)
MRVLITGATGLIGRAVTQRLLGRGDHVSAWVRTPNRARSLLGPEVELVAASAGQHALSAAVQRSEAVINLAGEPILGGRWSRARRERLTRSRLDVTSQLVAAIEQSATRPRVLISSSAVGYYGDRGDEALDEQSAPGAGFVADLCREWESRAARAEQFGVRVFIPRLGIVLSSDGGALAQMVTPMRLGLGGRIGSGSQFVSWIHLADLVELIAAALEDERLRGSLVAAAPMPVTNEELMRTLGGVLQRPSWLAVPAWALWLRFGEGAGVLLSSQRATSARLHELSYQWQYPALEGALRNLLLDDAPEIGRLTRDSSRPAAPSRDLERRPPRYLLRHVTRVNRPIEEVFVFFSRAENLGVMTPAAMEFRIVDPIPEQMAPGARIGYRLRLGPLPIRWRTNIEVWQPPHLFADSQQRGPYRCWWHEHHFRADGSATIMEDRVFYCPPLGTLGRLLNPLLIAPALRQIFRFRSQMMRYRFAEADPQTRFLRRTRLQSAVPSA